MTKWIVRNSKLFYRNIEEIGKKFKFFNMKFIRPFKSIDDGEDSKEQKDDEDSKENASTDDDKVSRIEFDFDGTCFF